MISLADLTSIGKVNKTHGIDGEMSVSVFDAGVAEAVRPGECMLFEIDGIFVPFFVGSVRPKGKESLLITFEGESSREAVAAFVGKDVYMQRGWVEKVADDTDPADGLYAGSLIGFRAITTDETVIGVIEDIDESSDNPLFIVRNHDSGRSCLIPIVDDFIVEIGDNNVVFDLPDGLLDL